MDSTFKLTRTTRSEFFARTLRTKSPSRKRNLVLDPDLVKVAKALRRVVQKAEGSLMMTTMMKMTMMRMI